MTKEVEVLRNGLKKLKSRILPKTGQLAHLYAIADTALREADKVRDDPPRR